MLSLRIAGIHTALDGQSGKHAMRPGTFPNLVGVASIEIGAATDPVTAMLLVLVGTAAIALAYLAVGLGRGLMETVYTIITGRDWQ